MASQAYFEKSNSLWQALEWKPSREQVEQLTTLQKQLIQWNECFNLTRLNEDSDYWISHVFDSLWPIKIELTKPSQVRKCIDVGTGCGFPGLAIAIALPETELVLTDSVHKKTTAVKALAQSIGLDSRVKVINERVELTGQNPNFRGKFDLAVGRAVAKAPVMAEYLVPLLKPTGEAIIFQGHWTSGDQKALLNALVLLKGKIHKVETCQLPKGKGVRHQIRLKTSGLCPEKYPRAIGVPLKKPLGG